MIPEREREALMRLTMCAREECIMCEYHKECDFDFQYELATESMNILAEALRKTEPQTDCNGCKFVGTYDTEFPCANCSRKTKDYYAKDEPQTNADQHVQRVEYVENDERSRLGHCMDDDQDGKWIYDGNGRPKACPLIEVADTQQTDCPWK